MRQKSIPVRDPAERVVKGIRRAMRRHFTAEDKIRIVLEGLRGEDSIAELCRREGSSRTSIIGGRRNFSRRARSGWPVIRRGRRPPMRVTTGMLDAKFTHTPDLEEAMSSWRRERNGDGGEHTR
jgi:transposase